MKIIFLETCHETLFFFKKKDVKAEIDGIMLLT